MYIAYVKSATAIVKIVLSKNIYLKIVDNDFLKSYIPSVEIMTDNNIESDATITIQKSASNRAVINYPDVLYSYKKLDIKDIISLIEFVLERCRQEKGIICIHGAGAIVKEKAIVCWGTATGMGKTSLAVSLSENHLFYSDEKILIDLTSHEVVGRIENQYISNKYWKEKYGDKEYYLHQNLAKDKSYKIGMFIQPILCEQQDYIFDRWDSKKFLWHLYEESSRKIRGTSRLLFDGTVPAMSLDTFELSMRRLQLIKKFVNNIPAIYFKGTSDIIKKIINDEFKEEH